MSDWNEKTLDELGSLARGKSRHRPRNAEFLYGGTYPFIQTSDVKNANFRITEYSQTYSDAGLKQSRLWPKDTLCITIAANIADTGILGLDACFPDSIMGFIPKEGVSDVRFVKYCFDLLQRKIKQISQGAAQDNLSLEKLLTVKFWVPDYPTQRRIASILSAYDHLIENNLKRIKLLEELARRTYEEWFVKFRINGKILDKGDFEIVSLRSLLKDTMNGGWGKENEEGSYNKKAFVLRGTDMPELAIGSMLNLPLRFHTEKNLEPRKLLNGDIVIELSNGNINNIGRSFFFHSLLDNLFEYPVMCASFCKLLRPLNEGNGVLAYLHINHIYKNNSMFVYKAQGANGINNFQVEEMIDKELIPVPKGKSLNKLTDNIKCALQMINTIRIQNHHLKTSRDILLPRLMNGKIIVE
jgi:type I restriction enzyme S subunit